MPRALDHELTIKIENYINSTPERVTPFMVFKDLKLDERDRDFIYRRMLYLAKYSRIKRLFFGVYQRTGLNNIEPGEME